MATIEVKIPDIGDFTDVPIIEVHVKPGDAIEREASLVTLESEKATFDVPSPAAGTVRKLEVKVGDRVKEGSLVAVLESADGATAAPTKPEPKAEQKAAPKAQQKAEPKAAPAQAAARAAPAPAPTAAAAAAPAATTIEVKIPDIGDFTDVPIIEVHVKPGDAIEREAPLVTLESEKATFDVPSPAAGTVRTLAVKVGDRVKEGSLVVVLESAEAAAAQQAKPEQKAAAVPAPAGPRAAPAPAPAEAPTPARVAPIEAPLPVAHTTAALATAPAGAEELPAVAHASPSVRRFARELGVALDRVEGTGPRGRITREDVQQFVKEVVARGPAGGGVAGLELPPWPKVDFAKFGPVEAKPLSRIKKLSKGNLSRNWVMIPHVTQHDEADVTELEAFRVALNQEQAREGAKVTMLAFVLKACVAALKRFPDFNASLDGDQLILKRYWHLGFAADTPNGLVVPVVRSVDQKGVVEIARELAELAAKAREGKLAPGDMSGGTFSVSSLGGIGGTAFTPIINAPEVAILGVSRSATRPVWDGKAFQPRLVLPLSLSYDHRVIDGAAAARFTSFLAGLLGDMRRAML